MPITAWVGGLLWVDWPDGSATLFHICRTDARRQHRGTTVHLRGLIGLACGGYLLLFRLVRFGGHAFRQAFFWVVLAMLLLTSPGSSGCSPSWQDSSSKRCRDEVMESVFRDRFATWHGVASVIYLIECALGAVLVWLQPNRAALIAPRGRVFAAGLRARIGLRRSANRWRRQAAAGFSR